MSTIPATYIDGHKVVAGHIPGARLMYVMSADTWEFETFRPGEMSGIALDRLGQRIDAAHMEISRIDQQPVDVQTKRRWWRR